MTTHYELYADRMYVFSIRSNELVIFAGCHEVVRLRNKPLKDKYTKDIKEVTCSKCFVVPDFLLENGYAEIKEEKIALNDDLVVTHFKLKVIREKLEDAIKGLRQLHGYPIVD